MSLLNLFASGALLALQASAVKTFGALRNLRILRGAIISIAAFVVLVFIVADEAEPTNFYFYAVYATIVVTIFFVGVINVFLSERQIAAEEEEMLREFSSTRNAQKNPQLLLPHIRKAVRLSTERKRAMRALYVAATVLLVALSLPVIAVAAAGVADDEGTIVIIITLFLYSIVFAIWIHRKFKAISDITTESRNANLSLEIMQSSVTQDEAKALRFFRINQEELNRYYHINIGQTKAIFWVGIASIFMGLVFAGGVIWAVTQRAPSANADGWTADGAAAVLGVAATIMTGFVGSVLLKMYQESAETLEIFHSSLSQTNAILFANVLAANLSEQDRIAAIRGMIESLARYRRRSEARGGEEGVDSGSAEEASA